MPAIPIYWLLTGGGALVYAYLSGKSNGLLENESYQPKFPTALLVVGTAAAGAYVYGKYKG